jgi:hypothetical protein
MALKMRQSLATLEEQFRHQIAVDRQRSEHLRRRVAVRSRKRHIERHKKRSSVRFWVLAASLLLTAIAVTIAMFETLYWLLG